MRTLTGSAGYGGRSSSCRGAMTRHRGAPLPSSAAQYPAVLSPHDEHLFHSSITNLVSASYHGFSCVHVFRLGGTARSEKQSTWSECSSHVNAVGFSFSVGDLTVPHRSRENLASLACSIATVAAHPVSGTSQRLPLGTTTTAADGEEEAALARELPGPPAANPPEPAAEGDGPEGLSESGPPDALECTALLTSAAFSARIRGSRLQQVSAPAQISNRDRLASL
jgi:hypothetical protein